ncbi:DUF418 domain-containing protein [Sphingomonas sp.]
MESTSRLIALDTIRGVAVMGILAMNIVGFATVPPAYFQPDVPNTASAADLAAHLTSLLLVDGKMRGLFSLLFGASLLLIADRAEAQGADPVRRHFARMGWLLVLGLAHLYLIWWGDILHHYAIIGILAFAFREASIRTLLGTAMALLVVHIILMAQAPLGVLAAQAGWPDTATAAQTLARLERAFGSPPPDWIAQDIAIHRGSYGGIVAHRWQQHGMTPLNGLFLGAETLAYMLLGMAALRSGLLSGVWPAWRYRRWAVAGVATLAIQALLLWWIWSRGFDLLAVTLGLQVLAVPLRVALVGAYACLVVLALRPRGWLTTRIAAVGRMAFSNYIASSLVCTALFYGYGFGLYAQMPRVALSLVVVSLWLGMLAWSRPWQERFAYGPLEWLWRSLALGRRQPFLRSEIDNAAR